MWRIALVFIIFYIAFTLINNSYPSYSQTCRDPLLWPFAQNSIWNQPIGSGATYVPANFVLPSEGYGPEENIIIMTPDAPQRTIMMMNGNGWDNGSQANRCSGPGSELESGYPKAPIPNDFTTLNKISGGTPNAAAGIILPDKTTLIQNQPLSICSAGGTVYSRWPYDTLNIKTSDGIRGAQGGAGMSSIGGAIRIHEMVAGGTIPHALKTVIYGVDNIYFDRANNKGWRWPAYKHDGGAEPGDCSGGNQYCGDNPNLLIGALLALPKDLDINSLGLTATSSKMMAKAMQDYGMYVVDNSAWPHVGIALEYGPAGDGKAKFNSLGGFNRADLDKIFTRLQIVNNNSPTAIGGGGTPRTALAPDFCGTGVTPGPVVTNTPPPTCAKKIQGDANCDGNIKIDDFAIWRSEFLKTLATKLSDFDANGVVAIADFARWRTTFLGASPTNPPGPTNTPVPGGPTPTQPPAGACIGGSGTKARIMPIGDSVTGGLDGNSYRKPLYQALVGNGQSVDFVGSVTEGDFAEPQHEGHGGWCMDDTNNHCQRDWEGAGGLSENIVSWLNTYDPQLMLINVGINDGACTPGNESLCTDASRQTRFKAFIDKIYATKPNMKIVVSHVSFRDSSWDTYNNSLTSVVNTVKATGKDIRVFNSYAGLTSGDFADGAHPGTSGNTKMGANWFNEIKGMICK